MLLTFADLLDHITAYSGDDASRAASAKGRAAVQAAYNLLPTHHTWSYLWGLGRVTTRGAVGPGIGGDTSSVAYDAATRTVTVSGATWPTWAADGFLRVNAIPYPVDRVLSSTTLTLQVASAPTADMAAGTEYQLAQDQYPLPADFTALDEVSVNQIGTVLTYMHPRNWASERRIVAGPGQPWMFSLVGDLHRVGRTTMALWPAPDAEYAIDFPYRRKPRALVYDRVDDGTVTVAAAGTTVTGAGTAFKAAHVGSVVRFAADNQTAPTGDVGLNPAVHEATVTAVASATSLTIDAGPAEDLAGVKYVLTDPVDVDRSVMSELLLREMERQWRIVARSGSPKNQAEEMTAYSLALTVAREADVRYTGRQAALRTQSKRSGFLHYPINFTGG